MSNLPNLRERLLTNTAEVLNGGKLYFYETGTTTPKDVFTAADLVTAHASPVVASTAGMFPEIYMTSGTPYRVMLKDSAGSTIFDVDGIYSVQSSGDDTEFRSQMYAAMDNPMAYGADGTGAVDDTTAVQDAIDAASSAVDLLGKTYRIDGTLTLKSGLILRNGTLDFSNSTEDNYIVAQGTTGTPVALSGNCTVGSRTASTASTAGLVAGDWVFLSSTGSWVSGGPKVGEVLRVLSVVANTSVTFDAAVSATYNTADTATWAEVAHKTDIHISDVRIICSTGASGDGNAIVFDRVRNATIRDCYITGCGGDGIRLTRSHNCIIENCTLADGTEYGILIDQGSTDCSVNGGSISAFGNSTKAFICVSATGTSETAQTRRIAISGVSLYRAKYGIYIEKSADTVDVSGCRFIDFSASDSFGVFHQGGDSTITGCWFNGVTGIPIQSQPSGCLYEITRILIDKNKIRGGQASQQQILYAAAADHVVITNNTIESTAAAVGIYVAPASFTTLDVIGNDMHSQTTANGIQVDLTAANAIGTAYQVNVKNNTIFCTTGTGIVLDDITRAHIAGNMVMLTGTGTAVAHTSAGYEPAQIAYTGNTFLTTSGIALSVTAADASGGGSLVIQGNCISAINDGPAVSITNAYLQMVVINGNALRNQTASGSSRVITVTGAAAASVEMLTVTGNSISGGIYGIDHSNTNKSIHDGNVFLNQGTAPTNGAFTTAGDSAS